MRPSRTLLWAGAIAVAIPAGIAASALNMGYSAYKTKIVTVCSKSTYRGDYVVNTDQGRYAYGAVMMSPGKTYKVTYMHVHAVDFPQLPLHHQGQAGDRPAAHV